MYFVFIWYSVLMLAVSPQKEALQHMRQERGKCTLCMPVYKVSTFRREGPSILLYTPWLNVYTGQNPRRHVDLKNTSQMRTICTQFGRNLSVYLSLYVSFFPGGGIFLQIRFSLVKCPSIITFIPSKIRLQYS